MGTHAVQLAAFSLNVSGTASHLTVMNRHQDNSRQMPKFGCHQAASVSVQANKNSCQVPNSDCTTLQRNLTLCVAKRMRLSLCTRRTMLYMAALIMTMLSGPQVCTFSRFPPATCSDVTRRGQGCTRLQSLSGRHGKRTSAHVSRAGDVGPLCPPDTVPSVSSCCRHHAVLAPTHAARGRAVGFHVAILPL